MHSVATCLIVTGRAKEASDFYCDVFGTEISQGFMERIDIAELERAAAGH